MAGEVQNWHVQCLHRRAVAYAKLHRYEAVVTDADAVIDMTERNGAVETAETAEAGEHCVYLLKAYHRKAQALWSMGEKVQAVTVYKEALPLSRSMPLEHACESVQAAADGIQAAATLMVAEMPHGWLADYYAMLLSKCESPHPLSRRDGLVLKRVPDSVRLDGAVVRAGLVGGLDGDVVFARACQKGVVDYWSGEQRMKSLCAYVRGYVYYRASQRAEAEEAGSRDGLLRQGEMDATVALVYYRNSGEGRESYPAAHALRGLCYEARGENVMAVMDVLQAIEGEATSGLAWDDEEEEKGGDEAEDEGEDEGEDAGAGQGIDCISAAGRTFEQALSRLLPRIPEHYATAINEGCGFAGLQKMMDVERERMQPEFLKKRPKYYYYFEWMKKRIQERHPTIAEGVMDKLLALDAGELDLLLQYPQAIDATVHELEGVLAERGDLELEKYEVPLLSWGDVQQYKEVAAIESSEGGVRRIEGGGVATA